MIAGAKLNQLDFSVTSISKRDRPHLLVGLLHAKPWQVAMIGLGTAATQLDTSVNIAFPAITRGFDLSIGDIQWVVICYVLTYASLLLAMGRIGDTVGHAVVLRIGLIWSTVALLLVGWSPSFGAMLLFRCLQGIGAALVLSCGAALGQRGFGLLNLVSVLANLAAFSVWLLVPYFLARVPGYSLTESGVILATAAAGAALAAPIGGRLTGRCISAQRLAIAGVAAIGTGLLLLGAWTEQTLTILRIVGLAMQGVGLGLFQLAYSDIVTAALPLKDRGVAGSLVLLTRTLGTVTAASVVLMVFETLNTKSDFLEAFQKTFQFAALLAFSAAGLLAISPRRIGDT